MAAEDATSPAAKASAFRALCKATSEHVAARLASAAADAARASGEADEGRAALRRAGVEVNDVVQLAGVARAAALRQITKSRSDAGAGAGADALGPVLSHAQVDFEHEDAMSTIMFHVIGCDNPEAFVDVAVAAADCAAAARFADDTAADTRLAALDDAEKALVAELADPTTTGGEDPGFEERDTSETRAPAAVVRAACDAAARHAALRLAGDAAGSASASGELDVQTAAMRHLAGLFGFPDTVHRVVAAARIHALAAAALKFRAGGLPLKPDDAAASADALGPVLSAADIDAEVAAVAVNLGGNLVPAMADAVVALATAAGNAAASAAAGDGTGESLPAVAAAEAAVAALLG